MMMTAQTYGAAARRGFSTASATALKRTPLFGLHVANKATMAEFCGYEMPVLYPATSGGVLAEHKHTRAAAGLFDVSHMGQLRFTGEARVRFLESLVVGDIAGLAPGAARLSLFTNEAGGIKDDTVIT